MNFNNVANELKEIFIENLTHSTSKTQKRVFKKKYFIVQIIVSFLKAM